MVGSMLLTTFAKVGRATVSQVGRGRLSPCRLARKVDARLRRRRRSRAVADVDWFDGIGADELAG
jgi:hypothetical protein